ncbi:non-ribosomal peptide synthetase [Bacillus sp. B19-2]|uniref:non-ribosomal peptide synthetase n=1 Tax=Bacillus sp. B19-2 TaxID=2929516 RepID=UPI001FBADC41|nr:non-ribosomal peptide synthetase [Bacillus sp. B19-2]MCJ2147810.1 amino acid adenylation domain-containing protein [Bacillus sp. B19-2]
MNSKVDIDSIYGLTPMQEGILYHSLAVEQDPYVTQLSFQIKGKLDSDIMRKSWDAFIDRHDIFRSVFNYDKASKPVQIVMSHRPAPFQYIELTDRSSAEQESSIKNFFHEDFARGFDLTKDSPVRLTIFERHPECFHVTISMHHIIVDGWSLETILRDLFHIYNAYKSETPLDLPELEPFESYVRWIMEQDHEQARYYWNDYLHEVDQQTVIPWRKEKKAETYQQEKLQITLDANLTNRIAAIARENHVTQHTVFQTAWALLLRKYNFCDDIVFGSVVSERNAEIPYIEQMVGLFINTVPVRYTFEGDKRFSDIIKEAQEHAIDSSSQSYYPLSKIQSETGLGDELINHIIAFENIPLTNEKIQNDFHQFNLEINKLDVNEQTNFDFNIFVIPGDQWDVSFEYNAYVYRGVDVERIGQHLQRVLEQITRDPDIRISDISPLTQEEEQDIHRINDTKQDHHLDLTLHKRFEQQVEQHPHRLAVVLGDQSMTYTELNERANRLAASLREKGVRPNSVVGIMSERSLDMVVGLLGILKAGGAYLPIDPAYPEDRIAYMLKDSDVQCLLHQSNANVSFLFNGCAIDLNDSHAYVKSCINLEEWSRPDDLAYVMYTSGSTGKPKGVMIEHRSVMNNMCWMQREFPLTDEDVIMQKTTFTFDVSVMELFWWYFSGATLCLLPPGGEKDPDTIISAIEEQEVSIIHFVPSMLQAFMEYLHLAPDRLQKLSTLRFILASGEALHASHANQFNDIFRSMNVELVNVYGPTEATIHVSYYRCPAQQIWQVPIGKPVDNMSLYVVDQSLQLQPVGVPGELCIGGIGLSRGYVNRPALNQEKFVQARFDADMKLYRTGDIARWLPNGQVEYLGRMDHQIKIKGYRIELGEIESTLLRHPAVQQAVVMDKVNHHGQTVLCAYIIQAKNRELELNLNDVNAFLAKTLPDHMLVQYVITLESLPMHSNGKINRKELPQPALELGEDVYIAPRNHTERLLADVWENVLGINQVGVESEFFSLGGDSIKAIQVSSRLQKHGLQVKIKDVFKYPTIAALSNHVHQWSVIADQGSVEGTIPFTPIQSWFFEQHQTGRSHWNQALMIYRSEGFDSEAVQKVFSEIVIHHDALRMTFQNEGSQIIQYNRAVEDPLFDFEVLTVTGASDQDKLIEQEANRIQASIDLQTGPLCKVALFKTDHGDHLLIVIHHLVVDGVSWRIILEDLALGYEQVLKEEAIQFPPKSSSFQEWAHIIKEQAQKEIFLSEYDYWKDINVKAPCFLETNQQPVLVKNSDKLVFTLDKTKTYSLMHDVQQTVIGERTVEVQDLLLTALCTSFQKWTGLDQLFLGMEGHGRESIDANVDVSRTVGWFTSLYPVCIPINGYSTMEEQIGVVQECLRTVPRKGIGYGILTYLSDHYDLEKSTIAEHERAYFPQISFNYLGQFDINLDHNLFTFSPLSTGSSLSPESERSFLVDIIGVIMAGELTVEIIYDNGLFEQQSMVQFMHWFEEHLVELIHDCSMRNNQDPSSLPRGSDVGTLIYPEITHNKHDLYNPFPLSAIQMAYVLGRDNTFEMGGTSTHVYTEIETSIDMERFNQALQMVITRHPMLRAIVLSSGEQQILEEVPEYIIQVEDLTNLEPADQEEYIQQVRERMSHHVFQPDQWPLFEFKALKLSEGSYCLCISRDLLIADAASMDIIGKELAHYYEQMDSQLSEPDITFRDYMLAYRDFKQSETYGRDRKYWLNLLEDFPPAPVLPYRIRPEDIAVPTFKRKELIYKKEDWDQLKKMAYQYGVTPSTLLCTVYAEVLSFWSNQQSLALNLTTFNRYPFHKDIEHVVGDFTSNLLLGLELPSGDIWDKARHVQQVLLEALEHRHYEGVEFIRDIINRKNIEFGRAVMPIVFTSVLTDEGKDASAGWGRFGDIKTGITQTSQVHIDFQATMVNDELWLFWDYVKELFDSHVIEGMFVQFESRLKALLWKSTPAIVEDSRTLSLIEKYNDTAKELPIVPLHQLFVEQVQRQPEATALVFGEEEMSYEELDQHSNRIAKYLQDQGVGQGDLIGIEAKRGMGSIINVLGVLKSGAGYVPVDPDYPEERKGYILTNSGCRLLLEADLAWTETVLSYDGSSKDWSVSLDDVAYVIYTSGSTGKPKGVITSHRSAVNTILDVNDTWNIDVDDVHLGLSSLCFDLSVYDVFGSLGSGGKLVLVEDQRDVWQVSRVISEQNVTVWNSVPAIMEMMLEHVGEGKGSESLRLVLLSGDWVPLSLPERITAEYARAQVVSLGGATEAAIWSVYYPVDHVQAEWKSIPYGYPLANQQLYILNYEGEYCPVGVPGELYIGGTGLAQGYQDDEEKTNAAFIEHPQLGRLYRTGDYGVLQEEGYIEFMGRRDQQIKIRGYRVELGEIESSLSIHDMIKQAVVVDGRDHRNQPYLCAYYVSEEELTGEELRIYLQRQLPEYMVPAYFIQLEELPLTPNGKIDRKVLPEPDTFADREAHYEAPRTETEQILSDMWCDVLDVERVSVHDNFFELGGNSIMMVQIRARINRELDVDINLREFLEHDTIAKMSQRIIAGGIQQHVIYPEVSPDQEHMHEPFPLTDVQMAYLMGREELFELGGVSTHGYAEIETKLDMERLNRALQHVIAYHPMLRVIVLPGGEQKILEEVPLYEIKIENLTDLNEETQKQRILEERERMSHYVFQPDQWPLFEYKAFKLTENTHYLFMGYDMLILDGASMQMIGRLLMQFYHDLQWEPRELTFTFRDYILAYHDFQTSETYARDKQYWLSQLEDFPLAPSLPLRKDPSQIEQPRFQRYEKTFEAHEWRVLKQKAQQLNVTPSALLCTAYAEVLGFWSNQSSFAVNLTVFNRYPFHEDVYDLIGDFTSVLLLDIKLGTHQSFWERARMVQDRLFEALEYRHYDGISFIRELSRYHELGTRAVMPIVFTSTLLGNEESQSGGWEELGTMKMGAGQTSQVYLDHQAYEQNGRLTLVWDYVEDLFDPSMIGSMFDQFIGLLQGQLEDKVVSHLTVNATTQQLITGYNDTAKELPVVPLHQLFVEQVQRQPEATALVFGEEEMSYEELDQHSNRIAKYLQDQGVGQGDLIGIEAKRGMGSIINVLGVLKSGAGYVPVDPDYPEERKGYILTNSGCRLLLEADLAWTETVLSYDGSSKDWSVSLDDVAYVIYTSGSTGKPKGVITSHRSAVNTILDVNDTWNIDVDDVHLGLSSLCFDLSVYDVFGSLGSGGKLVLVEDQRDVWQVSRVISEQNVTVWNSVPAIMEMMLEHVGEGKGSESLRLVLLSGDWVPLSLPERITAEYARAQVVSLGGATEAAIWSVYYPVDHVQAEWKSIPYGYPLANQQLYILNYEGEYCPVGVPGELYIGGTGLAQGYQDDEEKTNAAFIEHPQLGRLYRTGDYGVLQEEGYIEFMGRRDQQIKIRGYRVELGEIESSLSIHDMIKQAVVVDGRDHRNQPYLCAYYVSEEELTGEELRIYLQRQLPEYMVPAYFIQLEELPLTPNGKIDRKVLPEPEQKEEEDVCLPPRSELEAKLVDIWQDVLDVRPIGIDNHMFELGANSTDAIRFASAAMKKYHLEIPLNQIYITPTVRDLANYLDKNHMVEQDYSHECMLLHQGSGKRPKIFCFPPVVALGIVYQRLSEIMKQYAFYSFNFIECEDRVQEYANIIQQYEEKGPYTLLGISAGGNLAFEVAKELERRGEKIQQLILMDSFYVETTNENRMTPEESSHYAHETVEKMLELYPKLQQEATYFKKSVVRKIQHYYNYLDNLVNKDNIQGDIHLITSCSLEQNKHIRGDLKKWAFSTTGHFSEQQGYGTHETMLDETFVQKNGEILENILTVKAK